MVSAAGKYTLLKNQLLECECHVETGLRTRAHQVTTTLAITTSCQYKQCIILWELCIQHQAQAGSETQGAIQTRDLGPHITNLCCANSHQQLYWEWRMIPITSQQRRGNLNLVHGLGPLSTVMQMNVNFHVQLLLGVAL